VSNELTPEFSHYNDGGDTRPDVGHEWSACRERARAPEKYNTIAGIIAGISMQAGGPY